MTACFSPEMIAKIKKNLSRFETPRSAILPILNDIHDEHGFVSAAQVEALEKDFVLPKVYVQEVITFYSRYRQQKPGRYHVQFCDNIVCHMFDSARIISALKARAEKSEQGLLSVEPVPCLGVCDGAPAMLVNNDRYLKVNLAKADEIIDSYTQKDA